jgi:hypothetical protein
MTENAERILGRPLAALLIVRPIMRIGRLHKSASHTADHDEQDWFNDGRGAT